MGRLDEDHRQTLLGNPNEFEQILRQTRNYFTHPGIKKQTKVLTDRNELFLFNQKMHALLRLLVLMQLGLPEDTGFGPTYRQSMKWQ